MSNPVKRGTGTILTAALASLALLLAGCEADRPVSPPPGSSAAPGSPEPTLKDPAIGTLDVTMTAEKLTARFVPAEDYTFIGAFTIAR